MILKPFTVASGGKRYTFIDRLAVDSELFKRQILDTTAVALDFVQFEATCERLGLQAEGSIPSMKFGVFESGNLIGVWMMGSIQYVFGPWTDTVDWKKTNSDPAIFRARVMPSFALDPADENALAVALLAYLLSTLHRSYEDTAVGFASLHYAINKTLTDPASRRAIRLHNAAVAEAALSLTQVIDPAAADRTLVTVELA